MTAYRLGRWAALVLVTALTACGRAATGVAQAPAPVQVSPFTEADVRFLTAMIPHHSQAVAMARMAETRTETRAIQVLAGRIISAQVDEITLMQQWLRERNQPIPDPGAMHHQHGGAHAEMPGMLSAEQLAQLEAARGAEFDRLFLTFMIQHHRGAVQMVTELLGSYGAAQDDFVFKLASDVNVDQTTEIARMQLMLADVILGVPAT